MNQPSPFHLRLADPGELQELSAIDDDAGALFTEHGFVFDSPNLAAYVAAELARWRASVENGRAELAVDASGATLGFIALGFMDGQPYLDQLSVRRRCMQRGVGRALLARAIAWSRPHGDLWLTTYRHVAWNAPMYQRAGFVPLAEHECGPDIQALLRAQRDALPDPDQRIAMKRPASAS